MTICKSSLQCFLAFALSSLLGLTLGGCDLLSPEPPELDSTSWPVASSMTESPNGDVYVNAFVKDSEYAVGRSDDQGQSWDPVSVSFSPPAPHDWAVAENGTLFGMTPVDDIADSPDSTNLAVRVSRSADGRTWTPHNEGLSDRRARMSSNGNPMSVHDGEVYLATGRAVYRSGVQEARWEKLSSRFVYSLESTDIGDGSILYAAVVNDNDVPVLQKSQDGNRWTTVVDSLGVFEMEYSSQAQVLYLSQEPQTVYKVRPDSMGVKQLSEEVDPSLSEGETGRQNKLFDLESGPSGTLYAGLGAGAYRSVDGGKTWTECANDELTAQSGDPDDAQLGIPDVRDVLITSEGTVLAATWNGVYRSTNDCRSWSRVIGPDGAEGL